MGKMEGGGRVEAVGGGGLMPSKETGEGGGGMEGGDLPTAKASSQQVTTAQS